MESLQDFGLEIVLLILGGVASLLWSLAKPKMEEFINTITDEKRFGKAANFAKDAVELVEARVKEIDGNKKFEEALTMLSERLERNGIELDEDTSRMMIQQGWRAMDDKQRANGEKFQFDEIPEDEDAEHDFDVSAE